MRPVPETERSVEDAMTNGRSDAVIVDIGADKQYKTKRGVSVYFDKLRYEVQTEKKTVRLGRSEPSAKEILHGISGYVRPGEMLAVMGPSGSGKTTLLNLMAGRLGKPSAGEILFGGRQRDKKTRRKVAYVTQEDLFFSNLSVKDILTFTARVRLPDTMTRAEKDVRVTEVLKKLNLTKTADTIIGDGLFKKGISGGERKRVSIANELLIDPAVILLDEPTSGLDSNTALTVICLMKNMALEGKTVVSTIHQPSSQMFAEFDKLLLLCEGNTIYFGDAKSAYDYFSSFGLKCPFGYNLADFFLQLLTDEDLNNTEPLKQKLVLHWSEEEKRRQYDHTLIDDSDRRPDGIFLKLKKSVKTVIGTNKPSSGTAQSGEGDEIWTSEDKYVTSWTTQFTNLCWRAFLQKRGSLLETWPIIQVACTLFLVGLVWWRMPAVEATIQDRIGNLFFTVVFWGFFTMLSATYAFPMEKEVIRKDRSAGAYRLSAYFLAKSTMEIPLEIIYPFFFGVIVYWMANLNPNAARFFIYMLLLLTHVIVSQSAGLAISAATMNVKKATTLASIFLLASMMVAGFYVDTENLPVWIRWLQYVSYVVYSFSAVLVNEVAGVEYPCSEPPTEFRPTNPMPSPCVIAGEDVLRTYDIRSDIGIWGNFGVMVGFIFFFRALAYFFLRVFHRKHKTA
eukprot:Plantae.Rhodophyta-Purpureofilum_apyrenoidigerum.ctg8588.p1 GENE.Plantae.Rhodophyta-Purpureofilum_apyrenoidigerum.ctg8588~~Plantae.Rhodophyta-Purpureofilum_apyrenoidigerum.ctg8588.p1  ORF type:complete len:677 (-),score=140.60 Plantae.Rhodophyta-Purpureofilum_apyrenoidigerum.ctg8588:728-2758(-)